jgi:hypothetical protein
MPNLTGLRGNISVDPKFINADSGNFRLLQNSPCIDCGNPAITDMDGSVSDIGAIFK